MKLIPLTQGHSAMVDDADYDFLMQWKWYYAQGYAQRTQYSRNGNKKVKQSIRMHNVIMQPQNNQIVDHWNRNTLDNRRSNLRLTSKLNNNRNASARIATSAFKGVYRHGLTGKWAAHIQTGTSRLHLGLFTNESDAAKAYDRAAIKYHGEYAVLNFPELISGQYFREAV